MTKQEIKKFEAACQIERREDGYYIRLPGLSDWVGSYNSAMDALRYYRLIWSVE